MVKITAIISLILLTLAAVGTIVGFSTYWYRIEIFVDNEEYVDSITTIVESKYNGYKSIYNGDITTRSYGNDEDMMTTQLKFYKAALAMDILAFVNLFFAVIGVGIAAFKDITPANQLKVKNSVNGAFVFLIIAVFVFLGLPKAMKDDCRGLYSTDIERDISCDLPWMYKFQGKIQRGNSTFTYGPTTSWIGATVALGLTFFASILVNCLGALTH